MEELGIKSPSGKRVWRIKTIENILNNEKYTGNVVVKCIGKNPQTGEEEYYKAVHHHEGIISQNLGENRNNFENPQIEKNPPVVRI